jgi:hypothetical protein
MWGKRMLSPFLPSPAPLDRVPHPVPHPVSVPMRLLRQSLMDLVELKRDGVGSYPTQGQEILDMKTTRLMATRLVLGPDLAKSPLV